MRITQRRAGALVLLAVMVLAHAAMPEQTAGGSAEQSAASSPLTVELIAKVRKLALSPGVGDDRELGAVLAVPLGFASDKIWKDTEVNVYYSANLHGFAFIHCSGCGEDANDQEIVISVRVPKESPRYILAFRAHRDGTLVSAVRADFKTGQVTTIALTEAQANFAEECALWRDNIDRLLAEASKAPPSK